MSFVGTVHIMDLYKLNLVKFCKSGLVLGSSQFPLLPQLPQKTMLTLKVVIDSKLIISLPLVYIRDTLCPSYFLDKQFNLLSIFAPHGLTRIPDLPVFDRSEIFICKKVDKFLV